MLPECLMLQYFDTMVLSVREVGVQKTAYCLCEDQKSRLPSKLHRTTKGDGLDASQPPCRLSRAPEKRCLFTAHIYPWKPKSYAVVSRGKVQTAVAALQIRVMLTA